MEYTFRAFAEDSPGKVWQQEFNTRWPAYRDWFMRFGERQRPTYLESIRALKRHMPQIMPVYEQMVDLAGGGDRAARFLAQYCPPPCFVAVRRRFISKTKRYWCAITITRRTYSTG